MRSEHRGTVFSGLVDKGYKLLGIADSELFLRVVLRLILLTLCVIYYPKGKLLSVLFMPGVIFTAVLMNRYYWYTITSLFCAFCALFAFRYELDNHVHLLALMLLMGTIAIHLKQAGKDWRSYLGWTARIMLGLVFLFATLGKLVANEFLDGSFMEFNLLYLKDFWTISEHFVTDKTDLAKNRQLVELLQVTADPNHAFYRLMSDGSIEKIALLFSYWTILIELAIAVLFILPSRYSASKWRDTILIIFLLTTYPFLPVLGFARSIILLALTTVYFDPPYSRSRLFPLLYIALYILISLIFVPVLMVRFG